MTLEEALSTFAVSLTRRLLNHYGRMVDDFRAGEWDDTLAKAGKVVEATLKTVWDSVGKTHMTGRSFRVDSYINGLAGITYGTQDDCLRLGIPRACRFVYDLSSNRGGRHDPGDVDPNKMDATAAVEICAWIIAELVRYSQKGSVAPTGAQELVESLVSKKYPSFEVVDGRFYLHSNKASAPDVALATLAYYHPNRLSSVELRETLRRHRFNGSNISKAIMSIRKYIDDDGNGNLRLLAPGLQRGEEIIRSAQSVG